MKKCKVAGYWSCEKCIRRGSDKVTHIEMGKTTTEIIQFKSVDAPLRKDEEYLTYYSTAYKNVEDNHFKNKQNPSPFYKIVDLVKGFAMEPMHTTYGGAFSRWLYGIVNERKEGNRAELMTKMQNFVLPHWKSKPQSTSTN